MSGFEIFVANPIRKRRKKANKGASKMRHRVKRRKASKRVSRRHYFAANPVAPRRKRRKARRAFGGFRANPIRARARRAVSYATRGKGKLDVQATIMPALAAGAGAVLADVLMGYAPIPAALKTGPVRHVSKAAISLGAGYVLSKFANRKLGEMVAVGGLSIVVHDALREQLVKFAPQIKFGEYMDGVGYQNSGEPVGYLGEYMAGRSLDQMPETQSMNTGSYLGGAVGVDWDSF